MHLAGLHMLLILVSFKMFYLQCSFEIQLSLEFGFFLPFKILNFINK